ncbi:MAG: hypothetical protein RLN88_06945 [Ekhidna sp.]|uniref:hypothetical protein n=1 Tax=Ekhidna sp. TaxID=2608089 RepID=UPI0032EB8247
MKKLLFITAIAFATLMTSCSDDGDTVGNDDLVQELDIDSEATLESNYEDVDAVVEAGMLSLESGGRIDEDEIIECAILDHDLENKVLTIDYGDGCEGPAGRTRAGKIIISYSDHRLIPGAFREATFENFSIDGVVVEGTRRVENISENMEDDPMFSITLTGGKLTFEDETFATRESERTRTWMRASNPLNDEVYIDGDANGSRRDGVSYRVEILERIIYKRACWTSRVFIPVAGVKQITSGDNVAIIDYGDGRCDNVVTVSINGGEPFEVTITRRGRLK